MLLLAIDTSGKQGSIALARVEERNKESDIPGKIEIIEIMPLAGGTFSAQLIPQISTLISSNGYDKDAIGAFAVVSGPGSFTGLRVGLAAVKALAETLIKPIAAVSMLEVCAVTSGIQGRVVAALDAGRGDVYLGEYEISSTAPAQATSINPEHVTSRADFFERAKGWHVVTPDPAIAQEAQDVSAQVSIIAPISAADVARLGWSKIRSGETVTPERLEANYIRRTDAEILEKSRS
ncbi:MAG: tRNA (adenosine(37)-N6)-threonylcarbamoyltransferase complex dimerization subunit type 1 TsaB [Candidatus Sulfotelmatobacter sp.]